MVLHLQIIANYAYLKRYHDLLLIVPLDLILILLFDDEGFGQHISVLCFVPLCGIRICLFVRPRGWILSSCVYVELYTLVESSLEILVSHGKVSAFSLAR